MEKLIHRPTGELVSDDPPFLIVGTRFRWVHGEKNRGFLDHYGDQTGRIEGVVTEQSAKETRRLRKIKGFENNAYLKWEYSGGCSLHVRTDQLEEVS